MVTLFDFIFHGIKLNTPFVRFLCTNICLHPAQLKLESIKEKNTRFSSLLKRENPSASCSNFLASERMKVMKQKNMHLAKKKKVRWCVTRLRIFSLNVTLSKLGHVPAFALSNPRQVHALLPRSSHN